MPKIKSVLVDMLIERRPLPATAVESQLLEARRDVYTNLYASATTGCGLFSLRPASFAFFSPDFVPLDLRSNFPRISIEVGLNGVPVESVAGDPLSLSLRVISWLDEVSTSIDESSGLGLDAPSMVDWMGGWP